MIPQRFHDLLADERRAFLSLATLMADGTPQLTPIWFDWDGEYIRVNSARGRVKDRNMRARPDVACLIVDPDNPYRYVQVRGPVVGITEEGADDHILDLAEKYWGVRRFTFGNDVRVTYNISPRKVYPTR